MILWEGAESRTLEMETEDAECELCPGTAPCLCDVGALPPAPTLSISPHPVPLAQQVKLRTDQY